VEDTARSTVEGSARRGKDSSMCVVVDRVKSSEVAVGDCDRRGSDAMSWNLVGTGADP
jgi:hypothetical protein